MTSTRPNFNIIENYEVEVDYDEFEKDFLNPLINTKELKKKYNLGRGQYKEITQKVRDKYGLKRKPFSYMRFNKPTVFIDGDMRYIRENNGVYSIEKTVDGHAYFIGRFKDLESAMEVRNQLIESDWSLDLIYEMREKYPLKHPKDADRVARELYPKWRELYLYSPLSLAEINRKLNVRSGVYRHMVGWIHKERSISKRPHKGARLYDSSLR